MAFEKIRGTYDLLPEDSLFFYKLKKDIEKIFELSGFYYVESAILQPVEIFKRSIGSESDIVKKEMFEVVSNSQSIVLKAEETAPLMAGLSEKKILESSVFTKFFYFTKVFRHERPQKGRFREFYQYGCESIGDFNKFMDGEVIELGKRILNHFKVSHSLHINSIGCNVCRKPYLDNLKDYLRKEKDNLCDDCKRRVETNPLRVFDCKNEKCKKVTSAGPKILDNLCDDCKNDFEGLKDFLNINGIDFIVDPNIVRGLDYYEKSVFEFVETGGKLGSQSTLIGGGRYRYKKDEIFKNEITGVGFAGGVERLILSISEDVKKNFVDFSSLDIFIVHFGGETFKKGVELLKMLRENGVKSEISFSEGRINKLLSLASKKKAKYVIIIGEDELSKGKISLKDMKTSLQKEISINLEDLLKEIKNGD
uniref:Histidine--tRNA ligase n=1 Tax=candidate division WOR-3 bacterium TaxID=2052148 RepID=A0A7C3N6Y3_UNCW3